jgi:hypothetical protein
MHPVEILFKMYPAPRPVVCDLVYFEPVGEQPDYWTLRLYRDDFEDNSAEDKLVLHNWISDLIYKIREYEPHTYVEVYERVPK